MNFTPDGLVTLMGIVLSLVFAYFPWVKEWFDKVPQQWKPLINAGVLLFVAVGKLAVDCKLDTSCMLANWSQAGFAFLTALIANQTTFQVAVKQIKRAE